MLWFLCFRLAVPCLVFIILFPLKSSGQVKNNGSDRAALRKTSEIYRSLYLFHFWDGNFPQKVKLISENRFKQYAIVILIKIESTCDKVIKITEPLTLLIKIIQKVVCQPAVPVFSFQSKQDTTLLFYDYQPCLLLSRSL